MTHLGYWKANYMVLEEKRHVLPNREKREPKVGFDLTGVDIISLAGHSSIQERQTHPGQFTRT